MGAWSEGTRESIAKGLVFNTAAHTEVGAFGTFLRKVYP